MKTVLMIGALLFTLGAPMVPHAAETSQEPAAYRKENWGSAANYTIGLDASTGAPGSVTETETGVRIQGAATYKVPFAFETNKDQKIKLRFHVNAIAPNGSAWVIFHGNPANVPNQGDGDLPGLYVRLSDFGGSAYKLDAFYTDGINYSVEMIGGTKTYSEPIVGYHTIQFETSMVQGYTDGVRLFYKGFHFGDWLGYSMVKNKRITNENSELFVTFAGQDISLENIVPRDITPPSITYAVPEEGAKKGYSNEPYTFYDILVDDDIDHEVPTEYKLRDDSLLDCSDKLYFDESGHLAFRPLVAGEYTLQILATDYSNNVASKKITVTIENRPHYPLFDRITWDEAARRSAKYYLPKVRAEDYTEDESPKDNNITYHYSGSFIDDGGTRREVVFEEDDKGIYFIPKKNDAYLTDGVGEYAFLIEAENSYGSSFVEKTIWVKYDNVGDDALSKDALYKKSNWALSPYISVSEDEIGIAGSTYYKGGLRLEDGIRLRLAIKDLPDKGTSNSWFSVSLLTHPGNARYGEMTQGIHFMYFYEKGAFRYNIQYVMKDGSYLDIANNNVLYSAIPESFELEIDPFDPALDPTMDDNITISFDGVQIASYEAFKVFRSEFADNEGLVYLACGYYNENPSGSDYETTNNPKYVIESLIKTDKVAPTIHLDPSLIPTTGKVGEAISLPFPTATDDIDGEVLCRLLRVEGPDGRGVTAINNVFIPEMPGEYTVTYAATDAMGNVAPLSFVIAVEGTASTNLPLILGLGIGLPVLLGGGVAAFFLTKKKRKQA